MKRLIAAIVAALVPLAGHAAYPERPVRLIVPWAARGDTDNIFRPFAQVFQKHLGQTVVIANVGGASGTRGAKEAKDAAPDGYTLYAVHDYIHSTYYAGVADVQYTDFEPICLITSTPSVLTASPKTPWKSMKDLLADAKARPGAITVGAVASWSSPAIHAVAANAPIPTTATTTRSASQRLTGPAPASPAGGAPPRRRPRVPVRRIVAPVPS